MSFHWRAGTESRQRWHADDAVRQVEQDAALERRNRTCPARWPDRAERTCTETGRTRVKIARFRPIIQPGISLAGRSGSASPREALAENCKALMPAPWPVPGCLRLAGWDSERRGISRRAWPAAARRDHLAGGLADRDAITVRRPHHDALDDGLAADESLVGAGERGQRPDLGEQAQMFPERQAGLAPWPSIACGVAC